MQCFIQDVLIIIYVELTFKEVHQMQLCVQIPCMLLGFVRHSESAPLLMKALLTLGKQSF